MSEQHLDEDGRPHARNGVLTAKKPPLTPNLRATRHKRKHHRKRENKYPAPSSLPLASEQSTLAPAHDTPLPPTVTGSPILSSNISQDAHVIEPQDSHIALADWDFETDPALPTIAQKPLQAEPIVPTTPPIVEKDDEETPTTEDNEKQEYLQIDDNGKPFSKFSRMGEVFPLRTPSLSYDHSIPWRFIASCVLLASLFISTILVWQDLTATHLFANTLDMGTGLVSSQQDLGAYRGDLRLTAPTKQASSTSSTVLGLYNTDQNEPGQLLTLQGTSSNITLGHSLSLATRAITQDTQGRLLVESAHGLQVVTRNGQVIWHIEGPQPTRGVHAFAPASDDVAVYTVASLTHSQIAAYTLGEGHQRWTQSLPDTLAYTPPFVIDGETLYIASDHMVFALSRRDGSIQWQRPYAARTLLVANNGQHHLLLALSSKGIQALQSETGNVAWSFYGDPTISTVPTQFYQGTLGNHTDTAMLYATGVVWHIPHVTQEVRLFAINTGTGQLHWSQQLTTGPTGTDTSRIFQPLFNPQTDTVIVQRTTASNGSALTAYSADNGKQRWNTPIADINASSPALSQPTPHTLTVFTTTTNSMKILWTPSLYRTLILLLSIFSLAGLLWLITFHLPVGTASARPLTQSNVMESTINWPPRIDIIREWWQANVIHRSSHTGQIRRTWLYAIFAPVLVCLCIGTIILAHLQQPTQQVLASDKQGNVIQTATVDGTHQLAALRPDGTKQWILFNSEGAFSIPKAQTQTGTLLVALSGDTPHNNIIAPDDPAYGRPLDSMFALYLLDRATGHILWQQVVSSPDEQQYSTVLAVDATYIYVVGEHIIPSGTQSSPQNIGVPQLFAVNKLTGTVDWRIFGPTGPAGTRSTASTVLSQNGLVYWHIANTIFTIDANLGQIIARKT